MVVVLSNLRSHLAHLFSRQENFPQNSDYHRSKKTTYRLSSALPTFTTRKQQATMTDMYDEKKVPEFTLPPYQHEDHGSEVRFHFDFCRFLI
jgi:hypothetical protein